ncbi:MAG: histidinol-phosphatase HisJ family protein [Clostridiales bacterium]|nr:histidinol-phosphatase HisJ family protein [Clostridiales bacterium]
MFDYHIHTNFSDDAESPIKAVLDTAVEMELSGVALTDHLDPYYQDDEYPWELNVPAYERALTEAQARYAGRIAVAKGIELGLIEGDGLRVCDKAVSDFPFDFVIASVHHTERAPIHTARFLDGRTAEEAATEYYEALLACIKTYRNYDVLGHLNVIDRYTDGYAPESATIPYTEEILKTAVEYGKGLEINTSAFRFGMAGRGTPTSALLTRFKELGGEIVTIGSDAHAAKYVGAFIKEGEEILLAHGFHYFTTFMDRVPKFHRIG